MKEFKKQFLIFIINLIIVVTFVIGYDMIICEKYIIGKLIGVLNLLYSVWLFSTNFEKLIDDYFDLYENKINNKYYDDFKDLEGDK